MKRLNLKSSNFNHLLAEFERWLDTMGYARGTVYSFPNHVREFLHYLEKRKNLFHISGVKSRYVDDFRAYLGRRKNMRYGGCLSASQINKTTVAVNAFARFLTLNGHYLIDITLEQVEADYGERVILTTDEVRSMYEATFQPVGRSNPVAMGQRDRAIIAVFYSCGLRKDEGSVLNIHDIDLTKKLLLVRKGKGNRQRYVPIANRSAEDLRAYLAEGRYWFLEDHSNSGYFNRHHSAPPKKHQPDSNAFFLNQQGKRMKSFYKRLELMKQRAGIEKKFGLHSLRHSIATHLLSSGMDIEEIARFLGHQSLESTQIYTHLVNQLHFQDHEEIDIPWTEDAYL